MFLLEATIMALNFVQQFFFKLFAYIMLAVYSITPPVAPSTADVIKPAKKDAELVFARCPETSGVALAVYNRLIRSAGFQIINL